MNNSSNSNSPNKSGYDSLAAWRFFTSAGEEEQVAAGKVIFHEDDKASRFLLQKDMMYLLVEGEIDLFVGDRQVGSVQQGEIFGELASITHSPRSATAIAKTRCRLIALDEKQFRAALREHPEFSLTMMSLMVGRLRKMIARLNADAGVPAGADWNESGVFGKKQLMELVDTFGATVITRYLPGKSIMQEGQVGLLMYVVLEGAVEVTIQGRVVEEIGEGGMFGEMALIGRTERLASAVAVTECSLLAINRKDFFDLVKTNPEFGVALLKAVGERARFIATCFAL
jgi:CRP/FNR family cyclic AMP-dependent transcriptional regulator